jgi:molybdate transport system regulatory protein
MGIGNITDGVRISDQYEKKAFLFEKRSKNLGYYGARLLAAPVSPRLTLRIDFPGGSRLGHGKARLLELVQEQGSISAAGRAMGMSYRRAWVLVEELNGMFRAPLVVAQSGGAKGGGAVLTPTGQEVLRLYRALEAQAAVEHGSLDALSALRPQ